jgi:hypothetical protein
MSVKEASHAGVIFPLTRGGAAPADLAVYEGVEFDLRGDGEPYAVRLHTVDGAWTAQTPSGPDWETVKLAFSDF